MKTHATLIELDSGNWQISCGNVSGEAKTIEGAHQAYNDAKAESDAFNGDCEAGYAIDINELKRALHRTNGHKDFLYFCNVDGLRDITKNGIRDVVCIEQAANAYMHNLNRKKDNDRI